MFNVVKRLALFGATNVAVIVLLGVVMRTFGLDAMLYSETGLNLPSLLIFSALFGFAGSFISLALSKWLAVRGTGARIIEAPSNEEESWLVDTVRRQAEAVGLKCPDVAIFDSPEPNAFATGARANHALVAVSRGLLRSMNRREVEAVLAHEVSHIANGDMITMALMQGVVNTFVIFFSRVIGFLVDRLVFRTERGHGPGYWIVTIISEIVLGILAQILVMWYSRRREFRADAGAAKLESPDAMISALRALQRAHSPPQLPDSLAAFGIRGGDKAGFIRRLFRTHPPLDQRINALQRGS